MLINQILWSRLSLNVLWLCEELTQQSLLPACTAILHFLKNVVYQKRVFVFLHSLLWENHRYFQEMMIPINPCFILLCFMKSQPAAHCLV